MKKKERYVLGKGYVRSVDRGVGLFDQYLREIKLKIPTKQAWCYCACRCHCKSWTLVLER